MKRILTVAVLLAVLATVMAAAPGVARSATKLTATEQAVIAAVNQERTERGLRALRVSMALTKAARAHSRDMAHNGYFSHTSRNGDGAGDRVRRFGYTRAGRTSWMVGEALARTSVDMANAERIVAGWLRSPSHRRILLAGAFRDAGVGVHSDSGWRYFTLDLGRRVR